MARLSRLSIGGQLHVVLQRSRDSLPVFAEAASRQAYLSSLREAALRDGVSIHAFGMSPDEARLLVTPLDDRALGRMIQSLGRRFGNWHNRRSGRRGQIWEGRFHSTVVEVGTCFLGALRYVEFGSAPATPELAESGPGEGDASWSSAEHHLGLRRDPLITEQAQYWAIGNTPFERDAAYRRLMRSESIGDLSREVEQATLRGWVLGPEAFVQGLASRLERRLRPKRPGRPRTKIDTTKQ